MHNWQYARNTPLATTNPTEKFLLLNTTSHIQLKKNIILKSDISKTFSEGQHCKTLNYILMETFVLVLKNIKADKLICDNLFT